MADAFRADRSVRATQSPVLERNYSYRRRLPHFQKHGAPVFVTFAKLMRGPFTSDACALVFKHCRHDHNKKYLLHAVVVMPDHVHLLLRPLPDESGWPYSLPLILKSLKGASARSVNKVMGTEGPVWQDESFDHVLRNDENIREKMEYIRQNPVRKGLVTKPGDYPWLWIEEGWLRE